jgi:hypothetical protein
LQVLSDFASERASVVSAATSQVNAAGSEVEALRRLLRLKGRELQQLRHLAQEVLLQRSEVEIFLLSSLHQVSRHGAMGAVCCCLACGKMVSKGHGGAYVLLLLLAAVAAAPWWPARARGRRVMVSHIWVCLEGRKGFCSCPRMDQLVCPNSTSDH